MYFSSQRKVNITNITTNIMNSIMKLDIVKSPKPFGMKGFVTFVTLKRLNMKSTFTLIFHHILKLNLNIKTFAILPTFLTF